MPNSKDLESTILFVNSEGFELNADDTVIHIDQLSEHLSQQPGLLAYYGDIKVRMQEHVSRLKTTLDIFMAGERNKIREANKENKRIPKDDINDQIIVTEEYINLIKELRLAEHQYEIASAFYNAIRDKGMSLNSMASIYKAEMFVNDKVMESTFREQRRAAYQKRKET